MTDYNVNGLLQENILTSCLFTVYLQKAFRHVIFVIYCFLPRQRWLNSVPIPGIFSIAIKLLFSRSLINLSRNYVISHNYNPALLVVGNSTFLRFNVITSKILFS